MAMKELIAKIKMMASLDPSVSQTFSKTEKMMGEMEARAKKIKSSSIIPGNIQESQSKLSKLGEGFTSLGKKVQSVGNATQHFGKMLAPVSGIAAAGITASVKMASDFDDSMASVNTIAKLSSDKLKGLSNQLLNVAKSTGKSATEISEAAYQALSASVPKNQLVSFTKTAANLAKTGRTDTATAVDTLTTAMNAYGKQAGSAQSIADRLIETQNAGKLTVGELSTSIGKSIGVAKNAGVSINNLLSSYVMMTKQGISTRVATTQINSMLDELADSGSSSGKALKKGTGKSFDDLMKSGKSLGDVLGILNKSVKGNNEKFKGLFSNANAKKAAMTLLNGTVKGFNDEMGRMKNSTGNVSDALNKLRTPGAKARNSINAVKISAIQFGEVFIDEAAPTIDKVSNAVSKLTDSFNKMPKSEKQAIAGATTLVAVGSPVLIGIGKITSGVGKMVTTIGGGIGKVAQFAEKMKALKDAGSAAESVAEGGGQMIKWSASQAMSMKDLSEQVGNATTSTSDLAKTILNGTDNMTGASTMTVKMGDEVQTLTFKSKKAADSVKHSSDILKELSGNASEASSTVSTAGSEISTLGTSAEATASKFGSLTAGVSAGAVAFGVATAAVVGLSAVMIINRKHWQSTARAVSSTGEKYDEIVSKSQNVATSSNSLVTSTSRLMSKFSGSGKVAEGLASKIRKLSSVENKSSAQKQELKSAVEALNSVVPSLNLKYDEQKDKLSQNNAEIEKNISLLKQQQIQKTASTQASKLETKQSQLMIQQQKLQIATAEKKKEYNADVKNVKSAISNHELAKFKYGEASPQADKAQRELSKYNSKASKAAKQLDKLNAAKSKVNKSLSKVGKSIQGVKFDSALAQAKQAGKKIPVSLAAGMKSSMTVLPTTEKEVENSLKYKSIITKADKAGIKIPKSLSQRILAGSISVKKAGEQMANAIKFDGVSKKAKKAGIKVPKSLASGVNSGKMSASKATNRLNQVIKFDKAVKKAKSQGVKIPKGLVSSVASGKLSAAKASERLGNASTSKLDKSKDAKSKGLKTNKNFASGVGQTAAPSAAGLRAANAGVNPFKRVPGKVSNALKGLGTRISSAFKFSPPHIKTPHFSASGSFSIGKSGVSLPKVSVSWYKKGGIMTKPTVFGANGSHLLAGGEAGPEGIIPLRKLWENLDKSISGSVTSNVQNVYRNAGSQISRILKNIYEISKNSNANYVRASNSRNVNRYFINSHERMSNVEKTIIRNENSLLNRAGNTNTSVGNSQEAKYLYSIIKNGSLENTYNSDIRTSEVIRGNALARSSRSTSARNSLAGRTEAPKNGDKNVNISGITFAPNIVIKGNASKQDIIAALKESEDEFTDYLKQILRDEEDASYA